MGVAHLALDLRPGHQSRHGVHHDHVNSVGAHQGLGDLQGLFTGVRLADQQAVHVHPQVPGVHGIQSVLHVDEGGVAPALLTLGDAVQSQGSLAGGFRPVDLDDSAPGQAADAQGQVQGQGARGDGLHVQGGILPQTHYRAVAKLLFDLGQGCFQGLGLVLCGVGGLGRALAFRHIKNLL